MSFGTGLLFVELAILRFASAWAYEPETRALTYKCAPCVTRARRAASLYEVAPRALDRGRARRDSARCTSFARRVHLNCLLLVADGGDPRMACVPLVQRLAPAQVCSFSPPGPPALLVSWVLSRPAPIFAIVVLFTASVALCASRQRGRTRAEVATVTYACFALALKMRRAVPLRTAGSGIRRSCVETKSSRCIDPLSLQSPTRNRALARCVRLARLVRHPVSLGAKLSCAAELSVGWCKGSGPASTRAPSVSLRSLATGVPRCPVPFGRGSGPFCVRARSRTASPALPLAAPG